MSILRESLRHPLARAGAALSALGAVASIVLGTAVFLYGRENAYLSLFAWILAPMVFGLGVLFWLAGSMLGRRNLPEEQPAPYRQSRPSVYAVTLFALILLAGTSIGSYQAYEFTESTLFCGSVCHSVMQPERVAHSLSPHAQVRCASCHVGRTPLQYLEAKAYGLKELYLLATHTYPMPIPTPVHSMEPLRENCTSCHWERKYWGKLHRDYSHYIAANGNQRWTLKMNVKVGGMFSFGGEGEGIHWHMKISPKVTFVASDPQRQKIPWVKVLHEDGTETVYRSKELPSTDQDVSGLPQHEISCVDCHSRPAHQFKAPILAIDDAMARGHIDPELPDVKTRGVELLAATGYTQQEQAADQIRQKFIESYRVQNPDVFARREERVRESAETLALLYRQNFFPEMKADWRAYPDNIGHFLSDGCFRCHDGQHVSDQGKAISNDCSLCHEIVVQGPQGQEEANATGLAFRHPVDFGVPIGDMGKCTQCHDGTLGK